MAEKESRAPIELSELSATRFDLTTADLEIRAGGTGLAQPQLVLEGEDDAFEHSLTDGQLRVRENMQSGTQVVGPRKRFGFGRGSSDIRVASNIVSEGSITISGVSIVAGDGGVFVSSQRRKASLLLPEGHVASHDIDAKSGDIRLGGLSIRKLRVASMSGNIALRDSQVDIASLKAMSGDVTIENTKATATVLANTMSGDVDVLDSEAPGWDVLTLSGDITVIRSKGQIDSKTISGRMRTSE